MPAAQISSTAQTAPATGRGSGECHASSARPTKKTSAVTACPLGYERSVSRMRSHTSGRARWNSSFTSAFAACEITCAPYRITTALVPARSVIVTPNATTPSPSSTGHRPSAVKKSGSGTAPPRRAPASTSIREGGRCATSAPSASAARNSITAAINSRFSIASALRNAALGDEHAQRLADDAHASRRLLQRRAIDADQLLGARADLELRRVDHVRARGPCLFVHLEGYVGAHRAESRGIIGGIQREPAVDQRRLRAHRRGAEVAAVGDDDVPSAHVEPPAFPAHARPERRVPEQRLHRGERICEQTGPAFHGPQRPVRDLRGETDGREVREVRSVHAAEVDAL